MTAWWDSLGPLSEPVRRQFDKIIRDGLTADWITYLTKLSIYTEAELAEQGVYWGDDEPEHH